MPHANPTVFGDVAMGDEPRTRAEQYREIAENIRQLARQTRIAKIGEELFDLADQLDRMAELAKRAGSGPARQRTPRKS